MTPRRSFVAGASGAALVIALAIPTLITASSISPRPSTAVGAMMTTASPDQVRFTASGDISASSDAQATLAGIATLDPDLHLALGDLSYGTTGSEGAWCDVVTSRVGAGFPFEIIAGNHESNGLNGNINDFTACLPNQLPGVVGTYGRQYYVDVPAVNPVVRYIMISPALTFPTSGTWSYAAGTPRYQWTSDAIDGARSTSIPWVVVGMHKPCLSVGQYSCDPGADIMNLLTSKRVDLVLSGHEHLYARSKQLALGAGCTALVPGQFSASCVADADSQLVKGAGTVFGIVGTGGTPLRDVVASDAETEYFAARSGANLNPAYGNLELTATRTSLTGAFRPVLGATFGDTFAIVDGPAPPNQIPTADFTASCAALTCTFDASASRDPDGILTGYAWDFGDGSSGSGRSISYAYSAPGSFAARVTVTDSDAASASVTKQIVVTAPPTVLPFAADSFGRAMINGLGTADIGGPWTVSGAASTYSVDGTGNVRMATPGMTATLGLQQASSSNTDLTVSLTADRAPTGTGIFIYALGRRVASGSYSAKIVLRPSGLVGLSLERAATTGNGTVQTAINIPGLTYAAGETLLVRLQVTGIAPTTIRAKVWKAGSAEPAAWQRSGTDATTSLQAAGSVGYSTYISSTTTNAPVTVRFDDLVAVTP